MNSFHVSSKAVVLSPKHTHKQKAPVFAHFQSSPMDITSTQPADCTVCGSAFALILPSNYLSSKAVGILFSAALLSVR
jgi:hypothetical protein